MLYPGQPVSREVIETVLACLNNTEVKAEIARQCRIEIDNDRQKRLNNGSIQSYSSLTAGNVNMQARMAASGYDVYGRTILSGNAPTNNNNTYRKMKNKIKYGHAARNGYMNRGRYTVE